MSEKTLSDKVDVYEAKKLRRQQVEALARELAATHLRQCPRMPVNCNECLAAQALLTLLDKKGEGGRMKTEQRLSPAEQETVDRIKKLGARDGEHLFAGDLLRFVQASCCFTAAHEGHGQCGGWESGLIHVIMADGSVQYAAVSCLVRVDKAVLDAAKGA